MELLLKEYLNITKPVEIKEKISATQLLYFIIFFFCLFTQFSLTLLTSGLIYFTYSDKLSTVQNIMHNLFIDNYSEMTWKTLISSPLCNIIFMLTPLYFYKFSEMECLLMIVSIFLCYSFRLRDFILIFRYHNFNQYLDIKSAVNGSSFDYYDNNDSEYNTIKNGGGFNTGSNSGVNANDVNNNPFNSNNNSNQTIVNINPIQNLITKQENSQSKYDSCIDSMNSNLPGNYTNNPAENMTKNLDKLKKLSKLNALNAAVANNNKINKDNHKEPNDTDQSLLSTIKIDGGIGGTKRNKKHHQHHQHINSPDNKRENNKGGKYQNTNTNNSNNTNNSSTMQNQNLFTFNKLSLQKHMFLSCFILILTDTLFFILITYPLCYLVYIYAYKYFYTHFLFFILINYSFEYGTNAFLLRFNQSINNKTTKICLRVISFKPNKISSHFIGVLCSLIPTYLYGVILNLMYDEINSYVFYSYYLALIFSQNFIMMLNYFLEVCGTLQYDIETFSSMDYVLRIKEIAKYDIFKRVENYALGLPFMYMFLNSI